VRIGEASHPGPTHQNTDVEGGIPQDGLAAEATITTEDSDVDSDNDTGSSPAQMEPDSHNEPTPVPPTTLRPTPTDKEKDQPTPSRNKALITEFLGTWMPNGTFRVSPLDDGTMTIIMGNSGGKLKPWGFSGHTIDGNRLDSATSLITEEHADMVLITEGHITQNTASMIEEHSRQHHCQALVAPASTMVEATAGTIHETAKDPAAGIAAILSPALAARVRGPAQKLASGRVLHFALGDGTNATTDERLTHIVVVYGVSGERSETGARATLAKLAAVPRNVFDENP